MENKQKLESGTVESTKALTTNGGRTSTKGPTSIKATVQISESAPTQRNAGSILKNLHLINAAYFLASSNN